MKLDIVYKEMDSTEGIKNRIHERAEKLERFVAPDEYIRVVVHATFKGQQHMAEVAWHDNEIGKDIYAKAEGHDLYQQIDEIFEKAHRQIKEHHDKIRDAKRQGPQAKKMAIE